MKIDNTVSNLLFPPRCANCRQFLDITIDERNVHALCPSCRLLYENEKQKECDICGLSMEFCRCMPKNMDRAQCTSLLKLISYRKNEENFRLINLLYTIKNKDCQVNFDFVAEQMKKLLITEMRATGLMPTDCVITFLPRSRKNKVSKGFDQSLRLAKALSAVTGIEFISCFSRKFKASEQKQLNQYERRLNMGSAYKRRKKAGNKIDGKTVILVDDIVTSGSSMAACARIAYSMGAFAVMGVCLAQTEKIIKNKG